jgi:cytochrome b561
MESGRIIERRQAGEPGYSGVAKALHWLIVASLIAQYTIAWTMPGIHRGTRPEGLIAVHLSLGILVLALVILQLLWRVGHPVPPGSDTMPAWQQRGAKAVHALLYLLLLLLPLMGWANACARGWTIRLFGLFALPPILPAGSPLGRQLGDIHIWTSYALLAVAGLHLAAALYHHLWLRDRVLWRMLPGRG